MRIPVKYIIRTSWLATTILVGSLLYIAIQIQSQSSAIIIPTEYTEESINIEKVEYEKYEYKWNNLKIVISSNVGFFSPKLHSYLSTHGKINKFSIKQLTDLITVYFVATSYFDTIFSMQLDDIVEKFGHGHALPIIVAIAIENIQRPLPALFGNREQFENILRNEMVEAKGGRINPTSPTTLNIVVHRDLNSFLPFAQKAHTFGRAYYDHNNQEIGLLLDLKLFREYYGHLENIKGEEHLIIPAFISYVSSLFNDDSGHEIAHLYQDLSHDSTYNIPMISEGEALVQGFVRRRNGLYYALMYNTLDFWINGKANTEKLQHRIQIAYKIGKPDSPFETDRINELYEFYKDGKFIPLRELLSLDFSNFYSGTKETVRLRYLQSWATCLIGIRNKEFEKVLRKTVKNYIQNQKMEGSDVVFLESKIYEFLQDPRGLLVTKEKMWNDAEYFYKVDQNLSGLIYQWIYSTDPSDIIALIYLGDVLFSGRQYLLAHRYYNKAIQKQPENILAKGRIADIYAKTGQNKKAKKLYEDLIKEETTDPDDAMIQMYIKQRYLDFMKNADLN
jgi:tetratricopeptide (TPR) repeat protein